MNYLTDKAAIQRFPKVELHRHLEGTFPVKKLFEISLKNGLDFPKDFEAFKKISEVFPDYRLQQHV